MNEATETRQLITLHGVGGLVRGTYHKADGESSEAQRVGILILNSLSPTRAAAGDSAVYWADSFARSGYPAFAWICLGSAIPMGTLHPSCSSLLIPEATDRSPPP